MELRITDIEEAVWPAPARVLSIAEIMDRTDEIWAHVEPALDDNARDPYAFFASVANGRTILIEWGDNEGLAWLVHIAPNHGATFSCAYWGDWRKFRRKYGPGRDAMVDMLEWIFDSFNFKKLRAFIGDWNKKSWKMAERMGFKREGILREEGLQDGKVIDVYAYGLLRREL